MPLALANPLARAKSASSSGTSRALTSRLVACLGAVALLAAEPVAYAEAPSPVASVDVAAAVPAFDYDEIAAVRVLERDLFPVASARTELLEMGHGVPAPDRLALSGEPPVRLLMRDEPAASHRELPPLGLQVQGDRRLANALDQVRRDLAPSEDAAAGTGQLELPFAIECTAQSSVQQYLALFTAPGSKTLRVWIERSGRWQDTVTRILREEGVPEDLFYLAMIESGYRTQARSPANAGGMWQFIPGTAADMGLRIDQFVDERFDPIKSTRAAAQYLKRQHDRFGSWPLAMAAYNGGAGTVGRAIDLYNSNDYFKLVAYGAMYDETRRYVPKIMAAALISKNPETFGFDGIQREPAWHFDEVDVPGDLRLSLVADAIGVELEVIEELNPELLQKQTPPGLDLYTLRIPPRTAPSFVERFDDLANTYGTRHERVALRFGETLDDLALRAGLPARVLRRINGVSRRERVAYGTEIIVPLDGRQPAADADDQDDDRVVLVPDVPIDLPDRRRVFYHANTGDTLDEIAQHFQLRAVQVSLWNDLDPTAHLRAGLTLQLYLDPETDTSRSIVSTEEEVTVLVIGSEAYEKWRGAKPESASSYASYKVQRGDTVSKIAKRNGVSAADVVRWNNLDKNASIKPGMRLVLHGGSQAKPSKKTTRRSRRSRR